MICVVETDTQEFADLADARAEAGDVLNDGQVGDDDPVQRPLDNPAPSISSTMPLRLRMFPLVVEYARHLMAGATVA